MAKLVTTIRIVQRRPKKWVGPSTKKPTRPPGELCNDDLGTVEWVLLMILGCKFSMFDEIRDVKPFALIESGVSFSFISSSVAKHFG